MTSFRTFNERRKLNGSRTIRNEKTILWVIVFCVAVFLIILLGISVNQRANERNYESLIEQSESFIADNKLSDAKSALRAASDIRPEYSEPHLKLALVYFTEGNPNQGQSELDRAVSLSDNEGSEQRALAYQTRGLSRKDNGDYESAASDLSIAITEDPELWDLYIPYIDVTLLYANSLDSTEKPVVLQAAIDTITEYIDAHPDDALALAKRGMAYLALDYCKHALDDIKSAAELDPGNILMQNLSSRIALHTTCNTAEPAN